MRKKQLVSYNPFFFLPFLLWVAAGGYLLVTYNQRDLFYFINSRHAPAADVFMYYVTWLGHGAVITSSLALLLLLRRFRTWWYFISALLCNVLTFFVQQWLKSYYNTPRPINFYKHATWIHLDKSWPELLYRGYPSGHSEGAFCFCCYLSLLLPPRYRAVALVFFMLALAVCYSRIYLAAHFFADVYAGSIIGFVLCTIIYSVLKIVKDRFFKESATFN